MLGIADGELGLAERFAAALLDTLWTIPPRRRAGPLAARCSPGPAICTPRAAWLAPQERVPAEAAVGRIATETLSPYPPGIPAVLPGELLEPTSSRLLRAVVAGGGMVRGSADGLATFGVVARGAARGCSR